MRSIDALCDSGTNAPDSIFTHLFQWTLPRRSKGKSDRRPWYHLSSMVHVFTLILYTVEMNWWRILRTISRTNRVLTMRTSQSCVDKDWTYCWDDVASSNVSKWLMRSRFSPLSRIAPVKNKYFQIVVMSSLIIAVFNGHNRFSDWCTFSRPFHYRVMSSTHFTIILEEESILNLEGLWIRSLLTRDYLSKHRIESIFEYQQ